MKHTSVTRSHGFRPNRSAENAIADATKRVNQQNLTYVVDIDIQGFFDRSKSRQTHAPTMDTGYS